MKIRLSKTEDLDTIMNIYDAGRQTMRNNGNDKQWINGFPERSLIESDIEKGISYVFTDDDDVPHAVFAFIIGEDPTYSYIEDGKWHSDEQYGTIHRIASDGTLHGIVQAATDFGFTKIGYIRVDTHEKNKIMQKTVTSIGFKRAGIIYISDGSPRIAFDIKNKKK